VKQIRLEATLSLSEYNRLQAKGVTALLDEVNRRFPQSNKLQALHDQANITPKPTRARSGQWPDYDPDTYRVYPHDPDCTRLEADIQAQIVQALTSAGYVVLEGLKGRTGGKVFIQKSVPDLTIMRDGKTWFVELKRVKKYELDHDQLAMHRRIRAAGIPCWICHDLESVMWVLEARLEVVR
jgi:hypothetical protein